MMGQHSQPHLDQIASFKSRYSLPDVLELTLRLLSPKVGATVVAMLNARFGQWYIVPPDPGEEVMKELERHMSPEVREVAHVGRTILNSASTVNGSRRDARSRSTSRSYSSSGSGSSRQSRRKGGRSRPDKRRSSDRRRRRSRSKPQPKPSKPTSARVVPPSTVPNMRPTTPPRQPKPKPTKKRKRNPSDDFQPGEQFEREGWTGVPEESAKTASPPNGGGDFEVWLKGLDGGKGGLLRYLPLLQENFDTMSQLAILKVGEKDNGASVVSCIDPSFFEAIECKSLGHRLLFARGILAL